MVMPTGVYHGELDSDPIEEWRVVHGRAGAGEMLRDVKAEDISPRLQLAGRDQASPPVGIRVELAQRFAGRRPDALDGDAHIGGGPT
jgi:hypothetical protein